MPFSLLRRGRTDTIASLYGAIVAQARQSFFYTDCGVPDTAEGRFEMVIMHVALFFGRVRSDGEQGRALGQQVFDLFCRDMEQNLREMGVSDTGVPKKMRSIGEAFYGRARAYDAALQSPDADALKSAVRRNVPGDADAAALAAYVRVAARTLAQQELSSFARARIAFPAANLAAAREMRSQIGSAQP